MSENTKKTGANVASGMKRTSYFASIEAHQAFDDAIELVRSVIGKKITKQDVQSRLLLATARHADEVASDLMIELSRNPTPPTKGQK